MLEDTLIRSVQKCDISVYNNKELNQLSTNLENQIARIEKEVNSLDSFREINGLQKPYTVYLKTLQAIAIKQQNRVLRLLSDRLFES